VEQQGVCARGKVGRRGAYVWIGAEFEGVRDPEDEDECHQFSLAAVKRFSKAEKITVEEVKVVIEGNEPDAFWDMFELG